MRRDSSAAPVLRSRRRGRGALGAAVAGALVSGSVLLGPAPPAAAAGVCGIRTGIVLRDAIGNVFDKALYCDNEPSDVYGKADFGAVLTGWLKLSPSWFTCYTFGPKDTKGNSVWYYVQGDQVADLPRIKGWGAVPGEVVKVPAGVAHPFPGLPNCPWV
ncbi:hypothetical protein [Streptomyces albireticuli]|uniref:Uncharacterized protein n=1 Tax=Streptomyces albireticuli TaxID=1940 RepID=A0A2A2D539_9ACTN|nr:hypothetical protein [Streptomyces albireticuli]MCD9193482.1 hypothetical protein [Streptomyces albireticuli]PAU46422.1 hypothetical protein CK936_24055 [Streptomyces albireticuli]